MGRSRRIASSAGALVGGVLAAFLVAGCDGGSASGDTVVTGARAAEVLASDGVARPATEGQRLATGESLRTGPDGAAVLTTGGRSAYLGANSHWVVAGGGAATLRRGAVVVDGRSGPRLTLGVGDLTVRAGDAAVLRIERGFAVRVGALAGSARIEAPGDERLTLPHYYQVTVAGRSLPGAPAPLVLTDDAAEQRVLPDLVADDLMLRRTATALQSGPEAAALVTAARTAGFVVPASTASVVDAEAALPVAIARAAATGGADDVNKTLDRVLGLRSAGGSWGVVVRLVGTTGLRTSRAIDALLAGAQAPPLPGGGLPGEPGSGPPIDVPGQTPSGGPTARPTARPSPRPTGSGPTPSPSPSDDLVDVVDDALDDLLPTTPPLLPVPTLPPLRLPGLSGR